MTTTAMAVKRRYNIGIVVDDLGGTIDFFRELGLEFEGLAMIERGWAGRVRTAQSACRDCHDAYAGRPRTDRDLPLLGCHRGPPPQRPVNAH